MTPTSISTSGATMDATTRGKQLRELADLKLKLESIRVADGKLQLVARLENRSPKRLATLSRLWTLDSRYHQVADPQPVYRFVHSSTLRFLLGQAPLPSRPAAYKNVPYLEELLPGSSLTFNLELDLPIEEYSSYMLPADVTRTWEDGTVNFIEFFVDIVEVPPDKSLDLAPIGAPARHLDVPGFFAAAYTARSGRHEIFLPVRRLHGTLSRYNLQEDGIVPVELH